MTTPPAPLVLSRQGETAVLCDANPQGELSLALQQRLWALAACLREDAKVAAGIREVVLGMNNLLLILSAPLRELAKLAAYLNRLWQTVAPIANSGRFFDVPVRYGGPEGEDLRAVAQATGLSVPDYVARHASATYTVYALGSHPGFAYLGGLPPALAVPRRASPRPSVAAGTVMVGGAQTSIQARTTPSGWHKIGLSSLQCFDPQANPPALLAPGDRIRFIVQSVQP